MDLTSGFDEWMDGEVTGCMESKRDIRMGLHDTIGSKRRNGKTRKKVVNKMLRRKSKRLTSTVNKDVDSLQRVVANNQRYLIIEQAQ